MLRIAVCDDDENDIKEISNVLSNYCLKKSIEHKILTFFDALFHRKHIPIKQI